MEHLPPLLFVSAAAAVAPVLSSHTRSLRIPVVVFEIVLGVVIGPQCLGIVEFGQSLPYLSTLGMAFLFFMAGAEIDVRAMSGPPLRLATLGWFASLVLAALVASGLSLVGGSGAWTLVTVALSTTGARHRRPGPQGRGSARNRPRQIHGGGRRALGEVGPILLMSVLLARHHGMGVQAGLVGVFILAVLGRFWASMRVRPPGLIGLLARTMTKSGQLPIRLSLLLIACLVVLAEEFDLDLALGAFAAGMAVGLAVRDAHQEVLHHKFDAVGFGFLIPIFFVSSGLKLDVRAVFGSVLNVAMMFTYAGLLLLVRGLPSVLFRSVLRPKEAVALGFYSATSPVSDRRAHGHGRPSQADGVGIRGGVGRRRPDLGAGFSGDRDAPRRSGERLEHGASRRRERILSATTMRLSPSNEDPGMRASVSIGALLGALCLSVATNAAADVPAPAAQPATVTEPRGEAPVTVLHRKVATLRAPLLGMPAVERARHSEERLVELLDRPGTPKLSVTTAAGNSAILLDGKLGLLLTPDDADTLDGETLDQATQATRAALERVIAETSEARNHDRRWHAAVRSGLATLVLLLLVVVVRRARSWLVRRLTLLFKESTARLTAASMHVLHPARLFQLSRWCVRAISTVCCWSQATAGGASFSISFRTRVRGVKTSTGTCSGSPCASAAASCTPCRICW